MPLLGKWAARQPEKPAAIFADTGETISFATLQRRRAGKGKVPCWGGGGGPCGANSTIDP